MIETTIATVIHTGTANKIALIVPTVNPFFNLFFISFLLAIYKGKGYYLSTAPTRAHIKERAIP
ncbi:hypothetical protein [Escherichia phage AV123]|nr:hypothetical protein [Escherichia phage AV123]